MRSALALVAGLLAGIPLAAQAPARAAVGGPVPDFTFPAFQNGDGRQQLSEFRGQPVLIEFWGTH